MTSCQVDYYTPSEILQDCAMKGRGCGRIEHPLSKNGLCASCEVEAQKDELQFRMTWHSDKPKCIAAQALEVKVWQEREAA